MSFILLGFGNRLPKDNVIGLFGVDSKPMKRFISKKGREKKLVDAADGKKRKCLVLTEDDFIVLTAISASTLRNRIKGGSIRAMKGIISLGNENYMPTNKIIGVFQIKSEPIKKYIKQKRASEEVIDATSGKMTRSVILTTNFYPVLSSLSAEALAKRINEQNEANQDVMLNIGYYNFVNESHIDFILNEDSRPMDKLIELSKVAGKFLALNMGRKRRSIIVMDNGLVFASAHRANKLASRYFQKKSEKE